MRERKGIIDIGPDETRRQVRGPSEYYEMERHEIASRDYTLYRQELQP